MEVHVPDHPVMTWKQFFVHMGIVVLGLLIAIGLEQSVEVWHRHRERAELQESIHQDLEEYQRDAASSYDSMLLYIRWCDRRMDQIQTALAAGSTLPPATDPLPPPNFDLLTNPSFESAKTSSRLALLKQEDLQIYTEIDLLTSVNMDWYKAATNSYGRWIALEKRFGSDPANGVPGDYSKASAQDLKDLHDRIGEFQSASLRMISTNIQAHGAAAAILSGKRRLADVLQAEHLPINGRSPAPLEDFYGPVPSLQERRRP